MTDEILLLLKTRVLRQQHAKLCGGGFSEQDEGEIDLSSELHGEMFLPLRDDGYFRQFKLDPVVKTIVWPNGADFAPEFLYQHLKVLA